MVMSPATWANNNAYRVCPSNAKRREQSGKRLEKKKKIIATLFQKDNDKTVRLVPNVWQVSFYTYTARATRRRWCSIVERDIRSYIGSKYVTAPVGCEKIRFYRKKDVNFNSLDPFFFLMNSNKLRYICNL